MSTFVAFEMVVKWHEIQTKTVRERHSCPNFKNRNTHSHAPTPLTTKLHGSRQDLEKTTAFIARCGLTVQKENAKKNKKMHKF